MPKNPLGRKSPLPGAYSPDLLFVIPRGISRAKLNNYSREQINGFDLWRAYEVSWLNPSGKPEIRVATSLNIIESKSMKLYLNSLNNETFECETELLEILENDLSKASGKKVGVAIKPLTSIDLLPEIFDESSSLDEVDDFQLSGNPSSQILKVIDLEVVNERLYSQLFRSLCPVTGQPDWATFQIQYSGLKIDNKSLLEYLCSFRNHASYHEDCGEKIFYEISERCEPADLTISLNFLRRGGVDINVHRSTKKTILKANQSRLISQ
jgi:7-cyano-7-deazaguanine reductase